MATATELIVRQQLDDLIEVARDQDGWTVEPLTSTLFRIGLPASDGSRFYLTCDAEAFPTSPPSWRWCDGSGRLFDLPHVTPKEGRSNFFHGNGVVCAPWNRLAYTPVDARGPHSDWAIGDWRANANTGKCDTLAAMASRIAVELLTRFNGRKGAPLDAVA